MPETPLRPSRAIAPSRQLVAVTLVICAAALWATLDVRAGDAPPQAYMIFQRLFVFNDHAGALATLIALAAGLALAPVRRAACASAEWAGAHPRTFCGLAFVALSAGARFVYLGHPLSMDEYAPMLQANAFAHGDLAAHYPPTLIDSVVWPGFQGTFLLVDPVRGDVVSAYWPGLALLLTPFVLVHAPWALNAALSALGLALIGDFAARVETSSSTAEARRGWAMLAALASPAFAVNAMSFYAMPGALALNLLFLWLVLRPGIANALAAGVVGSVALVLHNPLPHLLMAVPALVWMTLDCERRRRLPAVLAGYLPLALLLGLGWPLFTSAMHLKRHIDAAPDAGFAVGWAQRLGKIFHAPSGDLIEARILATWKVWIWACPGLVLAPFVIRPRDAAQRLLLAAFLLTYAFYFLVPFDQGHGWGYRYVHPVWAVLPIAGGVWFARGGAVRAFGALSIAGGFMAMPVFLWETHQTIVTALAHRIEPPDTGRWVVFVSSRERYAQDVVQNLPGNDRVMYLVSQDDSKDRALMAQQFPQAIRVIQDARGSAWRWSAPAR